MTDTDRRAALISAKLKADSGERLTKDERVALWFERWELLDAEVKTLVNAGSTRFAIMRVFTQLVAGFVSASERADKLEDRIAALELEAAAKAAPAREEDAPRLLTFKTP